ncbi:MAG: methyltransferase [Halanaerobiaceae bacterium]
MKSNEKQLWYEEARSLSYFFHRQFLHFLALLILVPITWSFSAPVMGEGSWLGIADITWFWLGVGMAILHQIIVWIVFRLQLGWAALSKVFGRKDLFVWGLIFLPLLAVRPFFVFGLAYSTLGSLLIPRTFAVILAILLLIPSIFTFWSVFKYFGIIRAMGADHFRIRYRHMSLVKQGAFKYSSNAMYSFALFVLWSLGLILGSRAALGVALFEYAYAWVHYFCTEKPDMEIIYN